MRTPLALVCLLAAACDRAAPADLGRSRSALVGGTETAGHPAVVLLGPTGDGGGECTAVFVAPRVLLTAAHCVLTESGGPLPDPTFRIFLGHDSSDATDADWTTIARKNVHPHPDFEGEEHDVAVLVLDAPVDVKPAVLGTAPLTASLAGERAKLVGYGATTAADVADDGFGVKRELETTIVSLEDHFIEVGKAGETACGGDSGGPLLVDVAGVETLIGLDSFSDAVADCSGSEHYQRLDREAAFLAKFLAAPRGGDDELVSDAEAGREEARSPGGTSDPVPPVTSAGCAMTPASPPAAALALPVLLALALARRFSGGGRAPAPPRARRRAGPAGA